MTFQIVVYGLISGFAFFKTLTHCFLGVVYLHQALYRKWRPAVFDDVYGQEHITSVLRYEADTGKFNHAYLFCGSRGTGKTTCAKILAKVVNCEHPENGNPCGKCASCKSIESGAATDVIEMDAASNNGVDNIRDIKDAVNFAPAMLKYRVYIIDEVHMLSASAFNALLKTLEEPPEYVVFILATTELQKLPATIVSRCQRFDFRRISTDDLCARLSEIAIAENIDADPVALKLIARNAQGGMRDAISLLELCSGAHKKITPELVNDTIGYSGREQSAEIVGAVLSKNYEKIFEMVNDVVSSAKDITVFWQELISLYRDMLVVKTTPSKAERYLDLTKEETSLISSLVSGITRETLLYHIGLLDNALASMQRANTIKRIVAELTLMKMADETLSDTSAALSSRISKLETALATGALKSVAESVDTTSKADKPSEKLSEGTNEDQDKSESLVAKEANTASNTIRHADGVRILQKFKAWADVLEHATKSFPMIAGILKTGNAYLTKENGVEKYVIQFADNGFEKDMLEKFNGKREVRNALCVVLGRDISESDIIIEYLSGDANPTDSIIDEIIENSNIL